MLPVHQRLQAFGCVSLVLHHMGGLADDVGDDGFDVEVFEAAADAGEGVVGFEVFRGKGEAEDSGFPLNSAPLASDCSCPLVDRPTASHACISPAAGYARPASAAPCDP